MVNKKMNFPELADIQIVMKYKAFFVRPSGGSGEIPNLLVMNSEINSSENSSVIEDIKSNSPICRLLPSLQFVHDLGNLEESFSSASYIIELESLENPGDMFFIAHPFLFEDRSDPSLGLFRTSINQTLGQSFEDANKYTKEYKKGLMQIIKDYQMTQTQITQKAMIAQQYMGYCNSIIQENRNIQQHISAARASITNMNFQLTNFSKKVSEKRNKNFECEFCKNAIKDVLVLPCSHLVGCADCVKGRLRVDFNSQRNEGVQGLCFVCNNPIQDAKKVLYRP